MDSARLAAARALRTGELAAATFAEMLDDDSRRALACELMVRIDADDAIEVGRARQHAHAQARARMRSVARDAEGRALTRCPACKEPGTLAQGYAALLESACYRELDADGRALRVCDVCIAAQIDAEERAEAARRAGFAS